MKKIFVWILIIQVLIFLTMIFRPEKFSLLSYINSSFVLGGILVFIGAWIFVVQTGVFDIFTDSMRKVFRRKSTLENDEMRSPSELIPFSSVPILLVGAATLILMGISLLIYEL